MFGVQATTRFELYRGNNFATEKLTRWKEDNMAIPRNVFGQLAEIILEGGARKATKYISEREVVKATRKMFGKRIDRRDSRTEILFTVGRPNYEEREFIKTCKQAGEPFPVQKIQIKWPQG